MKKFFALFFISLFFIMMVFMMGGCVTQKRCNAKFPPQIVRVDSTIVEIRDTIIHDTITIAGEKIVFHDTIPCPGVEYYRETTKNNITAKVKISNGVIDVECKADSIKYHYEKLLHNAIKSKTRYRYIETIKSVDVRFVPFWFWVWLIIAHLIIFRKPIIKFIARGIGKV